MTHPTTRKLKVIAVTALLCILGPLPAAVCAQTPPPAQRTGLMLGLTSSNWDRQATAGIILDHSTDWSTMYAVDVGGGQTALQAQAMVKLHFNSHCRLSIFAGPEMLVYQKAPTLADKLTYFNSATGAMFTHNFNTRTSAWAAVHWNHSDAPVAEYKLSFGIILWFQ